MTDSDSLRGDLAAAPPLASYPASFTSLEAPASPLEALANEMNLGGGRACPMRAQHLLRAGMKALRGHDFTPDLKAAQAAEFELEAEVEGESRLANDRVGELLRELGEQTELVAELEAQAVAAVATVYLVQEWGIEYSEVLGAYASERSAVEAVRERLLNHDGWNCQGAVQRAHRRRVWRRRWRVTAHRWVGTRPWLRYQLARTSFRRVRGHGHTEARPLWVWSTDRTAGNGPSDRLGVFVYKVTP